MWTVPCLVSWCITFYSFLALSLSMWIFSYVWSIELFEFSLIKFSFHSCWENKVPTTQATASLGIAPVLCHFWHSVDGNKQNCNTIIAQYMCGSSLEEERYTFRTTRREHWLIGSVHGTPKLTVKKFRPVGFVRLHAQFCYQTKVYLLMVLLIQQSTATFIF